MNTRRNLLLTTLLGTTVLTAVPAYAQTTSSPTHTGTCHLTVDGTEYINGRCQVLHETGKMTLLGDTDSGGISANADSTLSGWLTHDHEYADWGAVQWDGSCYKNAHFKLCATTPPAPKPGTIPTFPAPVMTADANAFDFKYIGGDGEYVCIDTPSYTSSGNTAARDPAFMKPFLAMSNADLRAKFLGLRDTPDNVLDRHKQDPKGVDLWMYMTASHSYPLERTVDPANPRLEDLATHVVRSPNQFCHAYFGPHEVAARFAGTVMSTTAVSEKVLAGANAEAKQWNEQHDADRAKVRQMLAAHHDANAFPRLRADLKIFNISPGVTDRIADGCAKYMGFLRDAQESRKNGSGLSDAVPNALKDADQICTAEATAECSSNYPPPDSSNGQAKAAACRILTAIDEKELKEEEANDFRRSN